MSDMLLLTLAMTARIPRLSISSSFFQASFSATQLRTGKR